jgi:hypothetical protein
MLSAMVEARRREEEELQREAERAMAKRKKFKEVCFVCVSLFVLGER